MNGSQAHTTRVLKTLHATLFRFLPGNLAEYIPTDSRGLKGIAGNKGEPVHFFRDFCPKDHFMFTDASGDRCPKCKKDTRCQINGKPARRAVYYELEDYVKRTHLRCLE